tara:strand:- start:9 stop:215 length:207 start_codon:yes stop_codon:yes gene_type:complete
VVSAFLYKFPFFTENNFIQIFQSSFRAIAPYFFELGVVSFVFIMVTYLERILSLLQDYAFGKREYGSF